MGGAELRSLSLFDGLTGDHGVYVATGQGTVGGRVLRAPDGSRSGPAARAGAPDGRPVGMRVTILMSCTPPSRAKETMDITQLILDDHHEQRRLFAILEQVGAADTATLAAIWARLSAFLEVHAAAEEEIFYPELLRVGSSAGGTAGAEEETLDAIRDHNEIRDAIADAAGHPVGSSEWFAAVAAVNLANGDHMAEEEREGLTDFRRRAGLELRHQLAVAFAAFEARHFAGVPAVDRDPQVYVREAERASAAPGGMSSPDGSLGIGSLAKGSS